MAIEKYTLSGIKKVLIGPASTSTTLTSQIDITEYIAPGTLTRTKNVDNKERIVADGKNYAYVTFKTPGDPDRIGFSLLDQNPAIETLLSAILYDAATSTITELADRKIAEISMEIHTDLKNGKMAIIKVPSIEATMGTADPITFNNVEKFVIIGDIAPFTASTGEQALSVKQWFDASGNAINATPPTVSAGAANQTASTNPKVLTGTATAASPKTIVSQLWTVVSGPNVPTMATPTALSNSVSGLITGVYVFNLTATDSQGIISTATTTLTATIA